MQVPDVRKSADNLFRRAVAEKLVFRVGAEIKEWQYSNRAYSFNVLRIGFDGSYKTIAASRQRFDVAWRLGSVTQGLPQPLYRVVDAVVKIDERIGRPNAPLQFLARNQFPWVLQQNLEDL